VEILIDDLPAEPVLAEARDLAELIDRVRTAPNPATGKRSAPNEFGGSDGEPRMVVAVEADGMELTTDEIQSRLNLPLTSYSQLSLRTARAAVLVGEAMTAALGVLDDSLEQCTRIVEELSRSKNTEALKHLAEVMSQWNEIQQSIINSIQALNLDISTLCVGEQPLSAAFCEVRSFLEKIREVVHARDFVLLADLLQYELDPTAEAWHGTLRALQSHAQHPLLTKGG